MSRIGRDRGKFLSEVMALDMEEIQFYEAEYRLEREETKKAEEKAKAQRGGK